MRIWTGIVALSVLTTPLITAQSISGLWQATIVVNGLEIPFRMELSADGSKAVGILFNGDQRFASTSGTFSNGGLELEWDYYASRLEATLKAGALEGKYARLRGEPFLFHAIKGVPAHTQAQGPSIAGNWILTNIVSRKGESAWHFIVRQKGSETQASILRVDGDTGTLSGTWNDGKFVLSHFQGVRPALLEVTPNADGTLKVVMDRKGEMTAFRPEVARAKGLPQPTDPTQHTGVKDPSQPFHFSFADLNGQTVTDSDPRFRGKVVLINITGSWCPNCHDEAPFLAALYKKYRGQGLEIVALDFEEADQLKNPPRLHAFLKKYGIEYTVLLCGQTSEAKDKLSSASNWDAWPTTFFVGRDGHVRKVHAGFPSRASGEMFTQAKQEFTADVERLLAENALSLR